MRSDIVKAMSEPEPLKLADDSDLEFSLAFVLQHHTLGKKNKPPDERAARIIAGAIVRHLKMSHYVVMKRPPAEPGNTPHKI